MIDDHVEAALQKIRVIFQETAAKIEEIKPGEKIPATKLAEQIAENYNTTGASLYPVLKYLFDNYPGIEIRRGAAGGIYRPKIEAVVVDKSQSNKDSND